MNNDDYSCKHCRLPVRYLTDHCRWVHCDPDSKTQGTYWTFCFADDLIEPQLNEKAVIAEPKEPLADGHPALRQPSPELKEDMEARWLKAVIRRVQEEAIYQGLPWYAFKERRKKRAQIARTTKTVRLLDQQTMP